ncbi:MAG: diacylglycerol kinase family lipid kinase [Deltaproteobacteria bacterium]|nr:diacylglycerol kinase family lipid kinase [Deltaproteobacteria bacterium]
MKIALIVNPCSSGKTGKKQLPVVERELKSREIEYDLFVTEHHLHAVSIAEELPIEDYDGIACMGGDGTNCQVLNGLLKSRDPEEIPPLGIIPTGRGNSFVKDLDIETVQDGIEALARRTPRKVDVCSFTQGEDHHYFINLMGFGFVTDVAETAGRFRHLGSFSYVVGVLLRTIRFGLHEMELQVDGETISARNCFVEFCNSRFTGGNMLMAPDAVIDDGYFDIVIVGAVSRFSLIATFPKLFKGTHGSNSAVTFIKGKKAVIQTTPQKTLLPDGEVFGTTPTEINIHPKLVRYFV